MRILHVTPYYREAWAYGGIPRVATALCEALARAGHEVTVVTTDARDASERGGERRAGIRESAAHGVRVLEFPNLSNRLAYRAQLFVPLGLRGWLTAHAARFEVGHVHGHHHLLSTLSARALHRAQVPYLVAPNGTGPRLEGRLVAKYAFDALLGRNVLPNAALVTATSNAERRQLSALGIPEARIELLDNPLDTGELAPTSDRAAARRRYSMVGQSVAYLGKVTPRKELPTLIEAVARLPQVTLVVAGSDMGGMEEAKARARALGLGARVRFVGLLQGRERLEFLAAADAVAYAGRDEVFGLVALEALVMGTPVVVGDDSGCAELVRRFGGGLCVPPGNAAALAVALEAVLSRSPTLELDRAGPKITRALAADVVAVRLVDLYQRMRRHGA